jgi:hypothetical protein
MSNEIYEVIEKLSLKKKEQNKHPTFVRCIELRNELGYLPKEELNNLVKEEKIRFGRTLNYKYFEIL